MYDEEHASMIIKIVRFVYKFLLEFLFFFFSYIVGIVAVLSFGSFETLGLSLSMIGGFVIVSFIRNYLWRTLIRTKQIQKLKLIIVELTIYFLLMQLYLVLVIPLSSVVPIKTLASIGLIKILDVRTCDIYSRLEITKSIFGDYVDYKKIKVIEGGLSRNLWLLEKKGYIDSGYARIATTLGNTIYIYNSLDCPTEDTLFHEMTHVWQTQIAKSRLFGIKTVFGWIRYGYIQITNPDILYDYGGISGLRQARADKKDFFSFGIEQQAMIVEDLYRVRSGYSTSSFNTVFIEEYRDLLTYYVEEGISF